MKWRESEPDEKRAGGSLFINQPESGRSFPLAGGRRIAQSVTLAERAKLSTATMAAIHPPSSRSW